MDKEKYLAIKAIEELAKDRYGLNLDQVNQIIEEVSSDSLAEIVAKEKSLAVNMVNLILTHKLVFSLYGY